VTNAGFVEANAADGLRRCLAEEFSSIYVLHLRGNQRTKGEQSRKEGGKIFGSGSRAPIAITLLVKNPNATTTGQIFFHDIGDYLSREEKLKKITGFHSVAGIAAANAWQTITPDDHGDWLKQRDDGFARFFAMGDKTATTAVLFETFSLGIATGRDAWCYNSSRIGVANNIERMIRFYNGELVRFKKAHPGLDKKAREAVVDGFINTDRSKVSWNRNLLQDLVKERRHSYEEDAVVTSYYRPFTKQWLYYARSLNAMIYLMPRIFPNSMSDNLVICVNGKGARTFTAIMANHIVDLNSLEAGAQCFPLYVYNDVDDVDELDLFAKKGNGQSRTRRDGITDEGLSHFRASYPGEKISKEDVFYYVYGLLHSPDYRGRYADNLGKELPRIPCVKLVVDFWSYSKSGRELARLHLDYETVKPYPLRVETNAKGRLDDAAYRVEKMRYGKKKVEDKTVEDKTTLIYNEHITLRDVPIEAYEYVVNGKSALDWVVERQCVKTEKDSGIVNDANDWAKETMGNPKYPLELFQRVITVSLETLRIVAALPALEI
jgi:predicted helicase